MRKIGQIFRFLIPIIALVALVLFMTGAGRRRMRKAAFVAAYDRMDEAWNTDNVDALDEFMAPDCLTHNPPFPDIEGLEGYKKHVRDTRTDYPDSQLTQHVYIFDDDMGATMWTWRGTHKDTGKQWIEIGSCITKWVDGKCVEHWMLGDKLGAFQGMGFKLVPAEE